MAEVEVYITGHLSEFTHKKREFRVDGGADIKELVLKLNGMFPGIRDRLLDDQDNIREYVNIFVNGENARDSEGMLTKLGNGDKVHILPSVAGG